MENNAIVDIGTSGLFVMDLTLVWTILQNNEYISVSPEKMVELSNTHLMDGDRDLLVGAAWLVLHPAM